MLLLLPLNNTKIRTRDQNQTKVFKIDQKPRKIHMTETKRVHHKSN